jgi:hypothetical protein
MSAYRAAADVADRERESWLADLRTREGIAMGHVAECAEAYEAAQRRLTNAVDALNHVRQLIAQEKAGGGR